MTLLIMSVVLLQDTQMTRKAHLAASGTSLRLTARR